MRGWAALARSALVAVVFAALGACSKQSHEMSRTCPPKQENARPIDQLLLA